MVSNRRIAPLIVLQKVFFFTWMALSAYNAEKKGSDRKRTVQIGSEKTQDRTVASKFNPGAGCRKVWPKGT